MKRYFPRYTLATPETRLHAFGAFTLNGGLLAVPCQMKGEPTTPYAIATWAANEGLPIVLWVESERPKDINKANTPRWQDALGTAVGYAKGSGLVQFFGEAAPRRFSITFGWCEDEYGRQKQCGGTWQVEISCHQG